ncbi:MAG: c-type cytochrome [Betaproteobacteria bacterium]
MRLIAIIGVIALSAIFSSSAWSEGKGPDLGNKKAMCEGCHGIPDYRTAYPDVYEVPKLGGQTVGYLAKALQDYRAGSRKNPTMHGIAVGLTDQEIQDLATYYAGAAAASK